MASRAATPHSPSIFGRVAHITYHHRWLVVGGWILLLVAITALSRVAGGDYAVRFVVPGTESQRALDLLKERFPARSGSASQIVFHVEDGQSPLTDPAMTARVGAIVEEAKKLPESPSVTGPFDQPGQVSADGRTAFATLQYARQANDIPMSSAEELVKLVERNSKDGLSVEAGGQVIQRTERRGLGSTEIIGVGAAAVILVLAFGSIVAMGLPIVTALLALGSSFALIALSANFLDMTQFTPSFAAMIGLGVGIDYSLLVITRFREAIHSGQDVETATLIAVETGGRSVLFAGAIVIISMLGLLLIGIPFIGALGVAAAIVVALSVGTAMTLLPAALAIVGRRVDSIGIPLFLSKDVQHEDSIWFRFSHAIQRRPAWFAIAAAAGLGILAIPAFSLHTAFSDASTNPPSSHSRKAYDLLSAGFGPGFNGPLTVVVDSRGGSTAALPALVDTLSKTGNVSRVAKPVTNQAGDTTTITLYPGTSPQSEATNSLVHHLRGTVLPAAIAGTGMKTFVSGATASTIDVTDRIGERTPVFFAMVIGLSFLVLMCVFRSVLIPIKAALMNLLSVGAAYGVLVAIFQWGWLDSVLGISQTGPIEAFLPMMMFAILFGLSMDYEVFLVSRIREEYVSGMETSRAVAYGLASTARVISSAALIMIAVFGSFVLGDERVIKEFGLGLATAVFLDATIVRLILVPSLMELMGSWNWWLPHGLDRVLPRIHFERPVLPATGPGSGD